MPRRQEAQLGRRAAGPGPGSGRAPAGAAGPPGLRRGSGRAGSGRRAAGSGRAGGVGPLPGSGRPGPSGIYSLRRLRSNRSDEPVGRQPSRSFAADVSRQRDQFSEIASKIP